MSASVHGLGGRMGLRLTLCGVLGLNLFGIVRNLYILPSPDTPLPWTPAWLQTLDVMVWPVITLIVINAIGLVGLARGKREQLWFGLVALVSMAVLVEVMNAHVGQHRRRFYSTGACLTGWLVGLAVARVRGADHDRSERLAEAGGGAALAATYVNAGIQKLVAGLLFEDHSLQSHIFSHHEIDDLSLFGVVARFFAVNPTLTVGLAFVTVVVQAGAWVFVLGPRARMLWGTLLIGFHLGTLVFLHIIYLETTILLLAWSYPWRRIVARLRGHPIAPIVPDDPPMSGGHVMRLAGLGVLVIGVAWLVPSPDELPRDYRHRYEQSDEVPSDDSHERELPPTVATLGPLRVGDELGGWRIHEIELSPRDAQVELVRGEQRVIFGFSGPASEVPAGPHSLADLHIYFNAGPDLDRAAIDAVGLQLRDRLAGERAQPGVLVDEWMASARATLLERAE